MSAQRLHFTTRLQLATTVLFTPEMGARLAKARMYDGRSQAELGRELFISQGMVSDIEKGVLKVTDRFSVARFYAVMQDSADYVILGNAPDKYEKPSVKVDYWNHRLRRKGAGDRRE